MLVDLLIEDAGWDAALPDLQALSLVATEAALAGAGVDPGRCAVSILACGDTRIADLNSTFRERDQATNVLSWPAYDLTLGTDLPEAPRGRVLLGDLALALQTCVAEAQAAERPLKNHVTHLIIHGCLHLLGHDHQNDADAELMEGIERQALADLGIPDPYA